MKGRIKCVSWWSVFFSLPLILRNTRVPNRCTLSFYQGLWLVIQLSIGGTQRLFRKTIRAIWTSSLIAIPYYRKKVPFYPRTCKKIIADSISNYAPIISNWYYQLLVPNNIISFISEQIVIPFMSSLHLTILYSQICKSCTATKYLNIFKITSASEQKADQLTAESTISLLLLSLRVTF